MKKYFSGATLRRTNCIQTIYSSLTVQQNTLTLEQVAAVLNSKVQKNIAEIKNAYASYREAMPVTLLLMGQFIYELRRYNAKAEGESSVFRTQLANAVEQDGYALLKTRLLRGHGLDLKITKYIEKIAITNV